MVNPHGLAASIRSTTESEIYDLNNQNADSIQRIISTAFTDPFTHLGTESMIRITFITGAGKQARQKYDPDAAKVVKAALNTCGYKEDHGASCVMECGGSYKSQHDTGKNLRTIVVFPRVIDAAASAGGAAKEEVEPLIPEDSPGYKIAVCSMNVFRNMLGAKCPSWSQKKGCLDCLQALKGVVNDLDTKLMQGQPLDSAEQSFYDEVVELDTKINLVRHEMQEQVETGNVTKLELDMLLEQNATKLETLKKEGKPTTKALQRKELLENIDPVPPHLLKYNNEIAKLRKELIPLLQLEEASRGRLLSVKETQTLTRKDEIMEEIDHLEESSRGWFEEDNVFLSRVEASRERFASQHKSSKKKKISAGGGNTFASVGADTKMKVSSATKFYTPGDWSKTKSKKKKKVKGGGVFQAMMVDSSSDDDTEDDEEDEEEEVPLILGKSEEEKKPAPAVVTNASSPAAASGKETTATTSSSSSPTKKSKKKKKKNKSKSKQREVITTEEEEDLIAAASTVATPSEEEKTKDEEKEEAAEATALSQTLSFLQAYVIPLIVAILKYMVAFLVWLIGLVFGTGKKKR